MGETKTAWEQDVMQPTVETIRYHLDRFSVRAYFAPEVMSRMKVERYMDAATERLVWQITGVVATWREDRLLRVPANWWQHFKQRWFPTWALKRWPVLHTVYDAAVVLPRVPVAEAEWHTVEFPTWQKRPDEPTP